MWTKKLTDLVPRAHVACPHPASRSCPGIRKKRLWEPTPHRHDLPQAYRHAHRVLPLPSPDTNLASTYRSLATTGWCQNNRRSCASSLKKGKQCHSFGDLWQTRCAFVLTVQPVKFGCVEAFAGGVAAPPLRLGTPGDIIAPFLFTQAGLLPKDLRHGRGLTAPRRRRRRRRVVIRRSFGVFAAHTQAKKANERRYVRNGRALRGKSRGSQLCGIRPSIHPYIN